MSQDILIVDDEADIRNLVKGILEDEGYVTRLAANAKEAYAEISKNPPGLIVLDIWLQGSEHDGLEILANVKKENPYIPVVMISGHGTIETAVNSIRKGAYDFIEKPFKSDRLLLMIRRALETAELRRENQALKSRAEEITELIGNSPAIQNIKQVLERVAQTNSRVLLTGEAGTGKDIAARLIHQHSERADKPFLILNCATLRPDSLEVELFGASGNAEEGEKTGVLEQADTGTLLLDEVADMPLETQGKIVRVLQEQRFQKVGGDKALEVDVRVIASTNRDLEQATRNGSFREDLYYRLNVVPVHLPSLRTRPQDISTLVEYFTNLHAQKSGLPAKQFSKSAISALQTYDWPGNVRQLRNVIEWVMIMSGGKDVDEFQPSHLPPEISGGLGEAVSAVIHDKNFMELPLRNARELFEREYLQMQVERFNGNISKTSQFVGMERSALHRKLKSLQILTNDKGEVAEASLSSKRKRA